MRVLKAPFLQKLEKWTVCWSMDDKHGDDDDDDTVL